MAEKSANAIGRAPRRYTLAKRPRRGKSIFSFPVAFKNAGVPFSTAAAAAAPPSRRAARQQPGRGNGGRVGRGESLGLIGERESEGTVEQDVPGTRCRRRAAGWMEDGVRPVWRGAGYVSSGSSVSLIFGVQALPSSLL